MTEPYLLQLPESLEGKGPEFSEGVQELGGGLYRAPAGTEVRLRFAEEAEESAVERIRYAVLGEKRGLADITGNLSILPEGGIGALFPFLLIGILLCVYLAYQYDAVDRLRPLWDQAAERVGLRGSGEMERLQDRIDEVQRLALDDLEAAEALYEQVMIGYDGLRQAEKTQVYPAARRAYHSILERHVDWLADRVELLAEQGRLEQGEEELLRLQALVASLPAELRTQMQYRATIAELGLKRKR